MLLTWALLCGLSSDTHVAVLSTLFRDLTCNVRVQTPGVADKHAEVFSQDDRVRTCSAFVLLHSILASIFPLLCVPSFHAGFTYVDARVGSSLLPLSDYVLSLLLYAFCLTHAVRFSSHTSILSLSVVHSTSSRRKRRAQCHTGERTDGPQHHRAQAQRYHHHHQTQVPRESRSATHLSFTNLAVFLYCPSHKWYSVVINQSAVLITMGYLLSVSPPGFCCTLN